jgi:hypothetical protein
MFTSLACRHVAKESAGDAGKSNKKKKTDDGESKEEILERERW